MKKLLIFPIFLLVLWSCGGSHSNNIPLASTGASNFTGTWSGTWTDKNILQTSATMTVYENSFFMTSIDYQNVNTARFNGDISDKSIIVSASFWDPISFQTYIGNGTISVIDSHMTGTVNLNSFGTATFDFLKQ